jgi:hypothetical protein
MGPLRTRVRCRSRALPHTPTGTGRRPHTLGPARWTSGGDLCWSRKSANAHRYLACCGVSIRISRAPVWDGAQSENAGERCARRRLPLGAALRQGRSCSHAPESACLAPRSEGEEDEPLFGTKRPPRAKAADGEEGDGAGGGGGEGGFLEGVVATVTLAPGTAPRKRWCGARRLCPPSLQCLPCVGGYVCVDRRSRAARVW